MSDKQKKKNGLKLPRFNPEQSAKFAKKVADDLNIKSVLIGRLAVWFWLPDISGHTYTKDLDTAIKKADRTKLVSYLNNLEYDVRELIIGGVNIFNEKENINVDFIDRYSVHYGDLTSLFEEAIERATDTVDIEGIEIFVVSLEHLVAMKIATHERKDEEDAKKLLELDSVDIDRLRKIFDRHLNIIKARLEQFLRDVGHPQAYKRGQYRIK